MPAHPRDGWQLDPPRRLRVEMMISQLGEGGAERLAIALAEALDPERFSVGMIVTRPGPWPKERTHLRARGVNVLQLARRSRLHLSAWGPALHRLREADIVHAHMHGSNIWASVLGRVAHVPVVVATEHSWSFRGAPGRVLTDRYIVGRLADAVVAVSEEDRRQLRERIRIPAGKIRVLPTANLPHLEVDGVSGRAGTLHEELGLPAETLIVSSVAYFRQEKALDVLLDAFAGCPTEAHLVLAGDGELRPALEEQARQLGIADRVHFLGVRDDIGRILAETHVVAMSSDNEGSPLALIEAMAAGRAIAATSVGGIPDIAPNGEAAVLVPPRRPDLLCDAITRLLAEGGTRERLGAAARTRANERYSFSAVVSRWEELYMELYGRARRRQRGGVPPR